MSTSRYNNLVVQTPEGIQFTNQLASPVSRCIALVVDLAIIWMVMSLVGTLVALMQWVSHDFAMAFYILLYFVFNIGYFILLEMLWRGQTIGKRMMRLRVQDMHGLKLQPAQLVLRNLLRFVDSLPVLYFLGGAFAVLSKRSQRLGDLAAGTVVVRLPDLALPVLSELSENHFNSFREHPRLEALLRQRVPPQQAELALQSLRRRDEIEPNARARLFRELAAHLQRQVQFPAESTTSMSDEQYVRNCVDSIYRAAK
jgi:uncharacterized RDD family membrane protein YckC